MDFVSGAILSSMKNSVKLSVYQSTAQIVHYIPSGGRVPLFTAAGTRGFSNSVRVADRGLIGFG
jgi:hypothetical protein